MKRGWARGLIELRLAFAPGELPGQLFWPVATLVAIVLLRHRDLGGLTLGAYMLPGVLGAFVALGLSLMLQHLAADREDGTLLRARAVPHGIIGYFVGKLVLTTGSVLAYLAIVGGPGFVLVDGLRVEPVTLVWVVVLGSLATQPIGAILGALVSGSRGAAVASLPTMALIGVSGIFYPISALPGWVRAVAEVFPVYWLGRGMRAALADGSIGATPAVLGAWALLGVLVAPIVLRRMARRESGSRVASRRAALLQRTQA